VRRSHVALRRRAEVDKHLEKLYEVAILLSDLDQEIALRLFYLCPEESVGRFRVGIEKVVELFEFNEKGSYNLNKIRRIRFPSSTQ
jgi:hypothetical protein